MDLNSKILEFNTNELSILVSDCYTWSELYKFICGEQACTAFTKWLIKKQILKNKISTQHFKKSKAIKVNINDILTENSNYLHLSELKFRLFEENIKEEKCEICGQNDLWNNLPLELNLEYRK